MTFVSSDGVEQIADIRLWDVAEAQEQYPTNTTKQALYMGWSALHRDGIVDSDFQPWATSIKKAPDVDLEGDDDPKE
jgi:hypothetical protein